VPDYRISIADKAGRFIGVYDIECACDADAIELAHEVLNGCVSEIRSGDRCIAIIAAKEDSHE
jgi:hypothetical protein